ncbi:MAG: hypothetical protein ACXWJZ_13265, partial [Burkholderiaceae bacterium]
MNNISTTACWSTLKRMFPIASAQQQGDTAIRQQVSPPPQLTYSTAARFHAQMKDDATLAATNDNETKKAVDIAKINRRTITIERPEDAHTDAGCHLSGKTKNGSSFQSTPLTYFENLFPNFENLFPKSGYSSAPNMVAVAPSNSWETPRSTSGAKDCAMVFFHNDEEKTSGFIHYNPKQQDINEVLIAEKQITRMPANFNRVVIVPGSNPNT